MKDTKKKFIKIISIICLACISTSAIIGYVFSKQQLDNKNKSSMELIAIANAEKINSWMVEKGAILSSIAEAIIIEDNYDKAALEKYFGQMKSAFNDRHFCDLYFTYPDSTMACANGYTPDGTIPYNQRAWYKNPILTGTVQYDSPYMDLDTGNYIVTISKAIIVDGTLKGVLCVDIYADDILEFMNSILLPKDSYAMLIDKNLAIVTHPNKDYLYANDMYRTLNMFKDNAYGQLIRLINNKDSKFAWISDYDGKERIFFTKTVASGQFHVVVAIEKSQWNKEITDLSRVYIITMILLCLIVAAINVRVFTKELIKPVRDAEEAAKAKANFLSSMSHEIRTPINAMLGMNELIIRESTSDNITEYASNIRTAGKTLIGLVNDILNMSKIEAGKMTINPCIYSTLELVREIQNSHKHAALDKGLDFNISIDDNFPSKLYGDDLRVKEIFNNVLSNAVKYTEKGSIDTEVLFTKLGNNQVLCKGTISDTGIGIKEEDMKKITMEFERVDITRNRTIEGTGLGMAIVSNLINLMGGTLDIQSEYGKGTTVTFAIIQDIADESPINKSNIKKENRPFIVPKAKILVVDDKEINCKIMKKQLEPLNAQVDIVLSGQGCLELCRTNSYDIIFMDHMMPIMDGVETLKMLRQQEENKHTIVIVLTANAIDGAKEIYIKNGFDDYLSKPVSILQIKEKLLEYLPEQYIEEIVEEEL
ncbi:MAG: cache domain-containing protein [Anaerovoracaceae bacterium]